MGAKVFRQHLKVTPLAVKARKRFPPRFWASAHCAQCGNVFFVREKGAKCIDKDRDVWHCPECAAGQLTLPGVE